MEQVYPQETMGSTLLDGTVAHERRRVLSQQRETCLEVGEFTSGPLTEAMYGTSAHYHCVHLREEAVEALPPAPFFENGCAYLTDYMDELDARGIAYGYLNNAQGTSVSYRPERTT